MEAFSSGRGMNGLAGEQGEKISGRQENNFFFKLFYLDP